MTQNLQAFWRRLNLEALGITGDVRSWTCDPHTLYAGYLWTDKGMWYLDFDEGRECVTLIWRADDVKVSLLQAVKAGARIYQSTVRTSATIAYPGRSEVWVDHHVVNELVSDGFLQRPNNAMTLEWLTLTDKARQLLTE